MFFIEYAGLYLVYLLQLFGEVCFAISLVKRAGTHGSYWVLQLFKVIELLYICVLSYANITTWYSSNMYLTYILFGCVI